MMRRAMIEGKYGLPVLSVKKILPRKQHQLEARPQRPKRFPRQHHDAPDDRTVQGGSGAPEVRSVPARVGAVKPSLAPVRIEMLNTSGRRLIMLENLVMVTPRGRRWYATTVKNVLDRAGDQQVREAA